MTLRPFAAPGGHERRTIISDVPFSPLDCYEEVEETVEGNTTEEGNNVGCFEGGVFFGHNSTTNVVGRYVMEGAVMATDKFALLPGQNAMARNYTTYANGISGVLIDIWRVADLGAIHAGDFEFKVLTGDPPVWDAAPAPKNVSSETLDDGVTRVTLTWPDNDIKDTWLKVTVLPTANTGLDHADVFYFGNGTEAGLLPFEPPGGAVFEPGIVHIHGFDREDPGPGEDFSDNVSLTPASAHVFLRPAGRVRAGFGVRALTPGLAAS